MIPALNHCFSIAPNTSVLFFGHRHPLPATIHHLIPFDHEQLFPLCHGHVVGREFRTYTVLRTMTGKTLQKPQSTMAAQTPRLGVGSLHSFMYKRHKQRYCPSPRTSALKTHPQIVAASSFSSSPFPISPVLSPPHPSLRKAPSHKRPQFPVHPFPQAPLAPH